MEPTWYVLTKNKQQLKKASYIDPRWLKTTFQVLMCSFVEPLGSTSCMHILQSYSCNLILNIRNATVSNLKVIMQDKTSITHILITVAFLHSFTCCVYSLISEFIFGLLILQVLYYHSKHWYNYSIINYCISVVPD